MADNPLYGANLAVSPEALKNRRAMLAELLKQGVDTSPIRSPWQGAARLAQTLVGVMFGNKLDKEEREERQGAIKDWMQARQSGDTAQMQAQLLAHPWLMNAEHLLGATTQPILSGSSTNPNGSVSVQYPGQPTIGGSGGGGGGGQPPPPAPRAGGPATGQGAQMMPAAQPPVNGAGRGATTDQVVAPRPAAPGPVPPQAQQAIDQMSKLGMDVGTGGLIRQVNQNAWNEDIDRYNKSQGELQNLRLLRHTIEAYNPTRGDAGEFINRAKQSINGIVGSDVLPSTAPAEFFKNIGNVMASEINNKGRGTDLGLSTAQGAIPSSLQGSKEGALAMTDHLIQMKLRDRKLGETFINAMDKDPDHYISNRNEWLGRKENALTSPLTGRTTADEPTPGGINNKNPARYIWSREKGLQPQ